MSALAVALLAVGCALAGVAIGAGLMMIAQDRAFRFAARYQRSGTVEPPVVADPGRVTVASPEATAMRHISEAAVEQAIGALAAAYEAAGMAVPSRKALEREARELLDNSPLLGGVV